MIGNRLLIVDDEIDTRESLESLLSKQFLVTTAENAEKALYLARSQPFDAILLDIHMPGMNGIELCKAIRRDSQLNTLPILMISASQDENLRTECFLWGADDFIAKPYSGRELVARIHAKLCWIRTPRTQEEIVLTCGNIGLNEKNWKSLSINDPFV